MLFYTIILHTYVENSYMKYVSFSICSELTELQRKICLLLYSERFSCEGDESWRNTDIGVLELLNTCRWIDSMTTNELRCLIEQMEKRVKDYKEIVESIL
jgi:hypothetical protein